MRIRYLSFGLTGTVAGFLWATAVAYGAAGLAWFGLWAVWDEWFNDTGTATFGDVLSMDDAVGGFLGLAWFGTLVTGILFLIWFFQAYQAAASTGATGRSWGAGWTIGSWFIPVANLVIPKLVMNEVDRMSNSWAGIPPIEDRWRHSGRSPLSDIWWIVWVVAAVLSTFGFILWGSVGWDDSANGPAMIISAIGALLNTAAAALGGAWVLVLGRRLRSTQR
jgi:hypothetical protein